ncbi:MAG TPA: hypothetical protein VGR47_05910 [Terracidiphilus sp.]|nr:hypothetical protein [Terracidiphilus sp.]
MEYAIVGAAAFAAGVAVTEIFGQRVVTALTRQLDGIETRIKAAIDAKLK